MKNFILIIVCVLISGFGFSQQKKKTTCKKRQKTQKVIKKKTIATKPTTAMLNQEGILYLKEGQTVFLEKEQMNVSFNKILEDSRCPENARCIWSGVATAEVELMSVHSRPMKLKISDIDDKEKGYNKSQYFNGYEISLVEISPNRVAGQEVNLKGKYKISLKIVKI